MRPLGSTGLPAVPNLALFQIRLLSTPNHLHTIACYSHCNRIPHHCFAYLVSSIYQKGLIMSNVVTNQHFPAPVLTNDAFIDFVDMYYEYHLNMHDEWNCESPDFNQFIAMAGVEI